MKPSKKYGLADIKIAIHGIPTEDWRNTKMEKPPLGLIVDTKIEDHKGVRNEQQLKLVNNLWFVPDGSIYVYYEPTHWKLIPQQYNG